MLTKLAMFLGRKVGVSMALRWIRRAASGEEGQRAHAIYWALVGYKVWLGFAWALAGAAALYSGAAPEVVAKVMVAGGGFAMSAGLIDKAWRGYRPEALTNSGLYRLLAAYPAEVAAAFTLAAGWETRECPYGLWCKVAFWITLLAAGAAAQLGLLDAAWRAPGPPEPPELPLPPNGANDLGGER